MEEYVTFDDVLIKPAYSEIASRSEIDLSVEFLGMELEIPIIPANMDYVTGPAMASAMNHLGGFFILHRFASWESQLRDITSVYSNTGLISFSVGTRDSELSLRRIGEVDGLYKYANHKIVTIDVAHGHHESVINLVSSIKERYGDWKIIAGNVATAEATSDLTASGADAIKVGIGPGSVCTTRIVTGVGVPQLSAIIECAAFARPRNIPIIADGGIRTAGDVVKALAAGADIVMLGSLFAGTDETPGEIIDTGRGRRVKRYQGQSIFGTNDALFTREGISGFVDAKGPVSGVVKQLTGGLRSGMSYVGARNLQELKERAQFIRVSHSTPLENSTRVSDVL